MAELTWAVRRLTALLPKKLSRANGPEAWHAFPARSLVLCLEREVVPAIRTIWERPSFRQLALRPLETLLSGCDTQVRLRLGELQQAIRRCTHDFAECLTKHSKELGQHLPEVDARLRKLSRFKIDAPPLTMEMVQHRLNAIDKTYGSEWAFADEYFGPRYEELPWEDGKMLQLGDLIPGLSRDLHHVGNFIARCMLIRANRALNSLDEIHQQLHCALLSGGSRSTPSWQAKLEEVRRIESSLRAACLDSKDAVLAESAMTLVQVSAEFSRPPFDLSWLPVPAGSIERRAGILRHALKSKRDQDTAELIRYALESITKWWRNRPPDETELEEAIATGGLVLDEGALEAYWQATRISVDWSTCPESWKLLVALAKARGGFVTVTGFYSHRNKVVSNSALPNLKKNLGMRLPADLRCQIKAVDQGYRLDLPASLINVLGSQLANDGSRDRTRKPR